MCSHDPNPAHTTLCAWRTLTACTQVQARKIITAAAMIATVFSVNNPVHAGASLSIKTITWDVIGLDSNKPSTQGPVDFPLAVRVKNSGPDVATDVVVNAELIAGGNTHVNLVGLNTITMPSLAANQVADFYFHVRIDRPLGDNNAQTAGYFSVLGNQNTTKRYVITASASNASPISTPTNRQLFVEKILSQNRNSVAPMLTVDNPDLPFLAGQTRIFTLFSNTATGYDQQETSINFPNNIFQILAVRAVYTDPTCGCKITNEDQFVEPLEPLDAGKFTTNKVYVDGCGWVTDFNNAGYMTSNKSCTNDPLKRESPTGKIGGTIVTTYKVKILQNVTMEVNLDYLVHDHSGSSFHYNFQDDFFNIVPTNIFVAKTAPTPPVEAETNFTYMISVCNDGATKAEAVVLRDTLPACVEFVSATPPPVDPNANPLVWNLGTIEPGVANCVPIEITAHTACTLGSCTNHVAVETSNYETDYSDNEDTADITIVDSTDPEITCPQDVTLECPADTSVSANGTATATDNCPGVTVTHSDAFTPACGNTGVLTRTWTATDGSLNTDTCVQTITVRDTTRPTIADLPDRIIECGNSTAPDGTPTASDSCGGVTVGHSDSTPSDLCGNTGVFTRTWKATDDCGNMASSEQLITVRDTIAPSVTCPADINLPAPVAPAICSQADYPVIVVTDACDNNVTITFDPPEAEACFPCGSTTLVTVTAEDDCGNKSTCTFNVIVADCADGCSLTQGFWKNHPEDWPTLPLVNGVPKLTLGTEHSYTKEQCIQILQTPVKKNYLVALAHQLIAAKVNVLSGADSSCISASIVAADDLIGIRKIPPFGKGTLTSKEASFLNNILDDFNNGRLCVPHCDDVERDPVSFKFF